MTTGVAVPLHLAVHVLGLTVAAGLAVYALGRRDDAGPGWLSLTIGAVLLATSHAVSGALVAPDLAWPVYLRAAGYAALAVGSAGRLVGSGTAALVVAAPPGAYLAAAVAGAAAAVASFRGVLGRRRDAVVLALGIALWAGADLAARSGPRVAAGLSLAGSATVAAWLLWRARESLLAKIVASFVGALLVLVVGLSSFGGFVLGTDLQEDALDVLSSAAVARADQIEDEWTTESLRTAKLFAGDRVLRVLQSGDAAAAADVARIIAELPDTDVVVVLDATGRVLASRDWSVADRGPLSEAEALFVAGDAVAERALSGTDASGLIALGNEDVLAAGATPIFPTVDGQPRRDRLAGALVVARRVTDPSFIQEVATTIGGAATVLVGGNPAASTLPASAQEDIARAISDGEVRGLTEVGGELVLVAAGELGPATASLATLALTEDAQELAGSEQQFTRTLFLASLAGLGVAALLAAWAASLTTRPIRRLTVVAERVAAGERDVRTGVEQPDEVGRLAVTFDHMTGSLAEREDELREAATTEAALRGRLEVLTSSMGEGLVAVDVEGTVTTVNPAAERILRLRASAAVGKPVGDVLAGSDGAGGGLLEALGGPADTSVRAVRATAGRGRTLLPVAATAAPMVATDGTQLGRVYVLRDISGEVEVERMKTEFLSNISHELRTPLTPIKGYAEVMRRRALPQEKVAEFATSIAESTVRLERIIGMLVDFAALEANRMRVTPQPTALGDVVDEVLASWRERMPERKFTRRLTRGLPEVHVDPRLLRRVLEELIDNSVKFSDGSITLMADEAPGQRRTVRLTVRDRGAGIPEDQLELIGRDFHQIDGSATRRFGGLGLGLSLVRRIAERFGAEVVIESTLDQGTDVHLLLPVARPS